MKKILLALLAMLLCLSLFACGTENKEAADETVNNEETQVDAKAETKAETTEDTIVVVDMMGREVQVPADTASSTVASTYGVATPFLATLGISDRVIACNFKNKGFFRKCDEVIVNAGSIGTTVTLDQEALAAANPSVYICKISDGPKMEIAERLGIPAITLSAERPEEVMQAYEMLGKTFGAEERAAEINSYLQSELDNIDELAKTIPEESKVTALCMGSLFSKVAGEDMLQTIMLERVGAITLVDGIVGEEERYWADCGVEKVLEMNPEYIFVTSSAVLDYTMDDFYTDTAWSAVNAVKTKNIYQIPAKMDSWDMPGPAFVLGTYYMMHCMYPELVSSEMMQEKTDEYYQLFYGRTFTGEEINYAF